jgi:putative FmdB family regulatory protein
MPFYEYECQKCGRHHEVLQKISDAPLKRCPDCGKSALKRLVSAPVFRLTGSGWYETDFKSDKEAKRNLAGEKHDADKAEPAKTETPAKKDDAAKPAEKPSDKPSEKASPSVGKPAKAASRGPARGRASRRAPARAK